MRRSPKRALRRIRPRAIAATLAAATALAGCTGIQAPHPIASRSPHASRTALAGPQFPHEPPGAVGATALPTNIPNTVALRAHVQLTDCVKATGGWAAAGTAKNPTKKAASYVITVFFLAPAGTVLGPGQTTAHLAAGKTAKWHVSGTFTAPASTRCSPHGVG